MGADIKRDATVKGIVCFWGKIQRNQNRIGSTVKTVSVPFTLQRGDTNAEEYGRHSLPIIIIPNHEVLCFPSHNNHNNNKQAKD